MLRLVDKLTVRTRLWVLLGAGALGLFLLLVLALQEERALLLQDRQAKTRDLTETACGLLEHFHKLAGEGKLTRPMGILRNLGQVMARTQTDGDLTREVPVDGDDEISAVTRSFNQLLGSFRRSMHDVLDHLEHHQDCEGHQGHRGPDEAVGAEYRHRGCASR